MFHRHDLLPVKSRGVLQDVDTRRPAAVEHGIDPIIPLQPLRRTVLVLAQCNHADAGTALHLDEPDPDEDSRVLGMRSPADHVEAPGPWIGHSPRPNREPPRGEWPR